MHFQTIIYYENRTASKEVKTNWLCFCKVKKTSIFLTTMSMFSDLSVTEKK